MSSSHYLSLNLDTNSSGSYDTIKLTNILTLFCPIYLLLLDQAMLESFRSNLIEYILYIVTTYYVKSSLNKKLIYIFLVRSYIGTKISSFVLITENREYCNKLLPFPMKTRWNILNCLNMVKASATYDRQSDICLT